MGMWDVFGIISIVLLSLAIIIQYDIEINKDFKSFNFSLKISDNDK